VAVDPGGFHSVPHVRSASMGDEGVRDRSHSRFPLALIMDVRADAIAELDFGKTVQPSFISLVNILASSATP
jgi:hypothetical protein